MKQIQMNRITDYGTPLCLVAPILVAWGLALVFYVPILVEHYQAAGARLPQTLMAPINASRFVWDYWWALALIAVGAGTAFELRANTPRKDALRKSILFGIALGISVVCAMALLAVIEAARAAL